MLSATSPAFATQLLNFSTISSPLLHMGGHAHLVGGDDHHHHETVDERQADRERKFYVPSDMKTQRFFHLNFQLINS